MSRSATEREAMNGAGARLRQIVGEAARLFDLRGYHRVAMEDIAAAVGIQKPSLYHYIRSKDEILALIHHEFMDFVLESVGEHESLDPEERLRRVIHDIIS